MCRAGTKLLHPGAFKWKNPGPYHLVLLVVLLGFGVLLTVRSTVSVGDVYAARNGWTPDATVGDIN